MAPPVEKAGHRRRGRTGRNPDAPPLNRDRSPELLRELRLHCRHFPNPPVLQQSTVPLVILWLLVKGRPGAR